ncbi:alpha/beta hydrolase [Nocardia blacklockiae]|nr:alpha/beta hydrolase [Nocardia blacklockiae]
MREQFGPLLSPVSGPVAPGGTEAVETGEDVERVSGGHGALLVRVRRSRRPAAPKLIDAHLRCPGTNRHNGRVSDLHVHRYGPADGPLVLALHGLTGHGRRWEALATGHLPDVRVIAPDLRGHGRSTALPPWTFEAVVDDVAPLVDGTPAVVVGHSFGGAVAIHLAHRHPELVRKLVLLDPAIGLDPALLLDIAESTLSRPDYPDLEAARLDKLETAWSDVAPELLEAELAEHLTPTAGGRMAWRMNLPAVVSYWGQLARAAILPPEGVPTVLVYASKSPFVTAEFRAVLRDRLGDELTVHEFDCDHMVAQARPADTAAVVRAAL